MPRPRKDPSLLMDVDLRIPVTREQKSLILQAAFLEQSEFAAWARKLLVKAAQKRAIEGQKRKVG